jgi:hypothetical protein
MPSVGPDAFVRPGGAEVSVRSNDSQSQPTTPVPAHDFKPPQQNANDQRPTTLHPETTNECERRSETSNREPRAEGSAECSLPGEAWVRRALAPKGPKKNSSVLEVSNALWATSVCKPISVRPPSRPGCPSRGKGRRCLASHARRIISGRMGTVPSVPISCPGMGYRCERIGQASRDPSTPQEAPKSALPAPLRMTGVGHLRS